MMDIKELVRHRAPMLLIDQVIDVRQGAAEVAISISSRSSFFIDPQGVPAWIGVEYMAQTVAAIAGVEAKLDGEAIPTGYLLGTRRFHASLHWFPPGAELRVFAKEELIDDNGLGAYNCHIMMKDRQVAECRLTVYRRPAEGSNPE